MEINNMPTWKSTTIQCNVIYGPSTEPSIKRCTCANKRKNSGSRWTISNNITRFTDGSSQLETRCRSESQRQTEDFGPSVTHGWATQPKWGRSAAMVSRKNLGQYSSLSLSPAHLSDTTSITLSRIKCERYIFIKKCVRSFIEVRILCLIMFLLIFIVVYVLRYTTVRRTSLTWLKQRKNVSIKTREFLLLPTKKKGGRKMSITLHQYIFPLPLVKFPQLQKSKNLRERFGGCILLLLKRRRRWVLALSQQVNLLFLSPPSKSNFSATRGRRSTGEQIQQNKKPREGRKRELWNLLFFVVVRIYWLKNTRKYKS